MSRETMKELAIAFAQAFFLVLILAFCVEAVHCQTPSQGSPPLNTPAEIAMSGMLKACNAVADELTQARKLIEAQQAELAKSEDAFKIEQQRAALMQHNLDLQRSELEQRKLAAEKLTEGLALEQKANDALKQDLTKTKASLSLWKKVGLVAGGVAILLIYSHGAN